MDLNKLSTGDKVIAGSGILFLISMFLPWWGLDFGEFGSASNNGFDYFLTGWLPLLIIIAMVAQIAVAVIGLDGGDLGNEATGGQGSAPIASSRPAITALAP